MQLTLQPYPTDHHPTAGFIVAGHDPATWLNRIKETGLALSDLHLYPLPGLVANTIWGCLVISNEKKFRIPGEVSTVYIVAPQLYLPAFTKTHPALTQHDCQQIFGNRRHLFHPLIGLAELPEPISWSQLMIAPEPGELVQHKPAKPVYLPHTVSAFLVEKGTDDEILQQMQQNLFPQQQTLEDKPLTIAEKIKLLFYRMLFKLAGKSPKRSPDSDKYQNTGDKDGKGGSSSMLQRLINRVKSNPGLSSRIQKMKEDFANLEERNKKEMDKLIDMLEKDPMKALQYAIPIDEEGLGRGSANRSFKLSRRWFDFELGGSAFGSIGGNVVIEDSTMQKLRQKYLASAEMLVKNGQHEKAAFVYLKLLNQPLEAARVLKEGGFYAEAAAIYMKKEDRKNAAECYAKANMIPRAIDLYEKLQDYEVAGDLAVKISDRNRAADLFGAAAEVHISQNRHIKASVIYRNKLGDSPTAQQVLMDGWIAGRDAVNCLHNYFEYHDNQYEKVGEMKMVYDTMITRDNSEPFLHVIKQTFSRGETLPLPMRDIMFAIISDHAVDNPGLLKELKYLNPDDEKILRDVIVYRNELMRKKRLG